MKTMNTLKKIANVVLTLIALGCFLIVVAEPTAAAHHAFLTQLGCLGGATLCILALRKLNPGMLD